MCHRASSDSPDRLKLNLPSCVADRPLAKTLQQKLHTAAQFFVYGVPGIIGVVFYYHVLPPSSHIRRLRVVK